MSLPLTSQYQRLPRREYKEVPIMPIFTICISILGRPHRHASSACCPIHLPTWSLVPEVLTIDGRTLVQGREGSCKNRREYLVAGWWVGRVLAGYCLLDVLRGRVLVILLVDFLLGRVLVILPDGRFPTAKSLGYIVELVWSACLALPEYTLTQ